MRVRPFVCLRNGIANRDAGAGRRTVFVEHICSCVVAVVGAHLRCRRDALERF